VTRATETANESRNLCVGEERREERRGKIKKERVKDRFRQRGKDRDTTSECGASERDRPTNRHEKGMKLVLEERWSNQNHE
jgi:hypothetical protein